MRLYYDFYKKYEIIIKKFDFMSSIINRGYSQCLIIKKQKMNLIFNIVFNAHYHYKIFYK